MLTRRATLAGGLLAGCGLPPAELRAADVAVPPLAPRLDARTLQPLSAVGVPSMLGDLRYPAWLEGTWRCTNTIERFSMPLGAALVDGFTRATAEVDVGEQEQLQYDLRYVRSEESSSSEPVAQDRRFNAIEETNAFLGLDAGAVQQCDYRCCAEGAPHGRLVIDVEDSPDEAGGGAGATAGRINGAATARGTTRIDLRMLWVQWGTASGGAFVTSELVRQRVTRAADAYEPTAQDETTFLEILTRFERETGSAGSAARPRVRVRNRIANYLSLGGLGEDGTIALASAPIQLAGSRTSSASLGRRMADSAAARTALAGGRAISFFDYDWTLERTDEGGGLGRGRLV